MNIAVEISYYPLNENYLKPIEDFIKEIEKEGFEIQVGQMSTTIIGDFNDLMSHLSKKIEIYMEKYPSVFVMKIANACYLKS